MRGSGAVSVNDISRATGLSKMTIHKIIDHYLEEGMIAHSGKGDSTEEGGKKPNLFSFNAHCRYIFAVRLAGSFLSTAIVNLRGETIVGRRRIGLDAVGFSAAIRSVGDAFLEQAEEGSLSPERCLAAVVGCNGIVDVENGVLLASYQHPGWGPDLPIRAALRPYLPKHVPVHVDSWWRHLAHGEMHFAANGERSHFFLIGNSGDYVSGGMVFDGHVCTGVTGFAGEIGHLIVAPESGEVCVCGGVGCLEALTAPGRLVKRAQSLRGRFPQSRLFEVAGAPPDFAAICAAANAGDDLACTMLREAAGHFAVAVNNIVQISDPGTVVFFGDYAAAGGFFLDELRRRVRDMSLRGIDKRTRIEYSFLDDDHGIIGAANHMTDTLFAGGR